ncbi:hypothetical protein [Bradyrhizobium sp. OK095]|uniref:hypothetical protein n=1 Tax=Bradyrhizobium sp. OK095 TaxID=1882760 RepID=UPI0015A50CFF|nr:hypothetical protein [Bradyrhizobium sp. OK095]
MSCSSAGKPNMNQAMRERKLAGQASAMKSVLASDEGRWRTGCAAASASSDG